MSTGALSKSSTKRDLLKSFTKSDTDHPARNSYVRQIVSMNFASSKFILALALMLGAMAFGDRATAQERLRVAWAGGASNATIWIVQEKGLMKKQGVNEEFISVNASPMTLQAVMTGYYELIA